jgi:hypothetical protein
MRSLIPLSLLLTIFNAFSTTYGTHVPFEVRTSGTHHRLSKRSSTMNVFNNGNAQYIGNMTIGGTLARVLLDTGRYISLSDVVYILSQSSFCISSDLWVAFPGAEPQTTDLGKGVTLAYAVGSATGKSTSLLIKVTAFYQTPICLYRLNTQNLSSAGLI